jgi:hypothetical protein
MIAEMDVDTAIESSQEADDKVRHLHVPEIQPWYRSITIEPALFLLVFAMTLCSPVIQNLVLMKACLTTFGYNETVCNNLSNLKPVENEIQPFSAQLLMYKSLIEAIIPAGNLQARRFNFNDKLICGFAFNIGAHNFRAKQLTILIKCVVIFLTCSPNFSKILLCY